MNTTLHTPHGSLLQVAMDWLHDALQGSPRPAARRLPDPVQVLGAGETVEVSQPRRHEVVCLLGTLWITHDNRQEDTILERGGRYVAACNSRMLVHAMSNARMAVFTSPAASARGG